MPERQCPNCEQGMVEGRLGPVSLDLCQPCLSVWFDFGKLSQVVQAGPVVLRRLCDRLSAGMCGKATRSLSTGRCPVCRVPLSTTEFPSMPGIQMDTCTFCQGIWVSGQALSNIADRLAPPVPVAAAVSPQVPTQAPPVNGNGHRAAPPVPPAGTPRPAAPARASHHAPPQVAAGAAQPAARPAGGPRPAGAPRSAPAAPKQRETRDCPSCKQPNSGESAVCWACGGFLRVAGVGTCPACDGILQREETDGIVFGVCDGCAGVWLEEGVLSRLRCLSGYQQEELAHALSRRPAPRACRPASDYYCPHCRAPMFGIQLGMLSAEPVSSCPDCHATFLERGRLGDLLAGR